MFYTSYFAKVSKLPDGYVPVAVSASVPSFYTGAHYKTLCPPYDTFKRYKAGGPWEDFCTEYKRKLATLDFKRTVDTLKALADDAENIVLLCWEKSGSNYHRYLISEWLISHGVQCEELP